LEQHYGRREILMRGSHLREATLPSFIEAVEET